MSSKHVRSDVKTKVQNEQNNKVILLFFPFGVGARVAKRLRDLEPIHTSEEGATAVGEVGGLWPGQCGINGKGEVSTDAHIGPRGCLNHPDGRDQSMVET